MIRQEDGTNSPPIPKKKWINELDPLEVKAAVKFISYFPK